MKGKIKLRSAIRRRLIITSLLFVTCCAILSVAFFFGNNDKVIAAVSGEYRTKASGNWNASSTWQRYNGSSWVNASGAPSSADNIITIQNGHTVTITNNVSADQVVVSSGGILINNSGVTFTIVNGSSTDFDVTGIFRNAGTVTLSSGPSVIYRSGGRYQHNYSTSAGTIPAATWSTGSVCEVIGYTTNTSMPSGMSQSFSVFIWNCPSQTGNVNFAGGITTFNGNLIVESTGTNQLTWSSNTLTLTVNGDITVNGGILSLNNGLTKTTTFTHNGDFTITNGSFVLNSGATNTGTINLNGNFSQSGGTYNTATGIGSTSTINITGNFTTTGGTYNLNPGTPNTSTINLTGNFTLSGGTLDFASLASTNGTFNIAGNFTHTGGTVSASDLLGGGKFVFNKTGSQTFTASGNTVTGNVDYQVNSGSTLNMGTSVMYGSDFTLLSGGELGIGSPDGISASGSTGNIQVSGTRTYNSGAYYKYNGSGNQVSGDGLPSTISKLTINNGNFLTLTNNVSVSSNLDFISGKIITGSNVLHVTSTSGSAITGSSSSSYVAGDLKRTVSGSGTYSFPIGTVVLYEPMSVTLSSTTGFTSLVGSFVNGETNDTVNSLEEVVNGVSMTEMLNYGYWTLTPNSSITGGSYSVDIDEQGFSNMITNGPYFSMLVRDDENSQWQSIGTHDANGTSVSGSIVSAARTGFTAFYQFGIALGDLVKFSSPSLISGTDGQVGATYLFQDVMRNVDAWVKIIRLYNGATLDEIDNSSAGYSESFQPFVNYPSERDSYIEWEFKFKVANTSTDTSVNKFTATGIDVDGGYNDPSSNIREYVVATMPGSYSLDPGTTITMSNDSGRYKALAATTNIMSIDTARHDAMYQLNYSNVNTLMYRTGAVNNYSTTQTRQTSLYFRSFLIGTPIYALPIKLVSFNAKLKNEKVTLDWITASETNNDYFTIERSSDGETFKSLFKLRGAGNSSSNKYYDMTDAYPLEGISYYRLRQTDFDGKFSTSDVRVINNTGLSKNTVEILSLAPNPFSSHFEVEFTVQSKGKAEIRLLNVNGNIADKSDIEVNEGRNVYRYQENQNLKPGIYFVVIDQDGKTITKKIMKN